MTIAIGPMLKSRPSFTAPSSGIPALNAEKPSRTATKIARFVLLLDEVTSLRSVLPAGSASVTEAILRGAGTIPKRDIDLMRSPRGRWLFEVAERLLGRGQLLWFGVRKRWISEAVAEAIASGARQLLVVGAGFDALAVSVARAHPEVLCIEVDAPPTAVPKCTGVEAAGLGVSNHIVVGRDLTSCTLPEVLSSTAWDIDTRSIVVAEGLLMYLKPPDVARFMSQVRGCCSVGSRFVFSSMDVDVAGRPRLLANRKWLSRLVRFALSSIGERLQWGLAPSAVREFLEAAGYRLLEQPSLQDLRRRYLDPLDLHEEPLAPYEHLVLAEVAHPANADAR